MSSLLNKIKQKLFQGESSNVFRGMFTLLIGAGLARVVGLISIPILARIYSPEDYGVLALYTSFVAILAPFLTLRYVQAIPLPKTDTMAFNLFLLCFKLIVFGSVVVAIILFTFGETLFGWFNMQALMPWWWLVVIGAAGTAVYELFSLWATRKKQYKVIAKTQFTQSLIGNLAKIGLGLIAFKPGGLIVGQFLSQSAGITSFVKEVKYDFKNLYPKIKNKRQKFLAKYFQDFVWYRLPSQILMILSIQAPVLMMAALYNKEVTGQLSLAMMVLSLPVGLIGSAMAKAYYAEIAELGKNNIKKITEITITVQKKLFLVGIPFAILVYLLSEFVFVIFFGEEWLLAGTFASILAPFILFQFTSSPLMEVINILGAQVVYLILHSLRIIGLLFIYLYIYYSQEEVMGFVGLISIYLAVFYFFASLLVFFLLINAKSQRELK